MNQGGDYSLFGKINILYLLSFLSVFLSFLTRPRSLDNIEDIKNKIPKDANLLYIVENRSFCDYLVLYNFCSLNDLPIPKDENILTEDSSSFMFLNKVGLFQTKPTLAEKKLDRIINSSQKIKKTPDAPVRCW